MSQAIKTPLYKPVPLIFACLFTTLCLASKVTSFKKVISQWMTNNNDINQINKSSYINIHCADLGPKRTQVVCALMWTNSILASKGSYFSKKSSDTGWSVNEHSSESKISVVLYCKHIASKPS